VKVKSAEHVATAAGAGSMPPPGLPEFAFLGRSNVGKSSLLNKLAGRKKLAYTSSTPGKTRLLHFFRVTDGRREALLVDLPGYGWAKVSRAERRRWQKLVEAYLERREPLRACVLLHDIRRDPTDDEQLLAAWLEERNIDWVVAVTKVDKLSRGARGKRLAELRRAYDLPAERLIATSATSGDGIADLWRALDSRLG
jgi:GTP-binding protein